MNEIRHFVHRPNNVLKNHIREILWVRSDREREQILLPETNLTLVLRLSGGASLYGEKLPSAILSGLQEWARRVKHAKESSLIIVRFTEVGAAAFLRENLDLFYSQTIPLADLIGSRKIEDIQSMLSETIDLGEQIRLLERFLLNEIEENHEIPPQIIASIRMIQTAKGRIPIAKLAASAYMSQSSLERHFRSFVGTSPKMFSRLVRLQNICRLWDAGKSLTEIAYEAGYTDQPHLIRDFRLFTNMAPEDFFHTASPRNLPIFYK